MWNRGCGVGEEDRCWVEIGGICVIRDGMPEVVENWGLSHGPGRRKNALVWHLYSLLKIFKQLIFMGG